MGCEMRLFVYKYKTSNSGVAALEFAIIAPVMMMILFGIIAYGIFFGAANSVQQLAANSARAAMGGLSLDERQSLVDNYVETFLAQDGLLLQQHLAVTVDQPEDDDTFVKVTVAYDASQLPVWNLYQGLPMPERRIVRQSLIRTGGF